jgi:hypothetical protein
MIRAWIYNLIGLGVNYKIEIFVLEAAMKNITRISCAYISQASYYIQYIVD